MIDSNSVDIRPSLAGSIPRFRLLAAAAERSRALTLAAVVATALAVRIVGLGASGFSEDEVNKLRAIAAYGHLDFTANAEHPMLMKLADWASLSGAAWWNAHERLASLVVIAPEAALRFPNALVGAGTAGLIFLLSEALFDRSIAAWASLLWALDANAAAINRIGKEDTFLLFFLLLAAFLYERGKRLAQVDPAGRDRWLNASGASFGLMLASKYMPHYFGLHVLFNCAADRAPADDKPDRRPAFFAAMGGAFALCNFAILLPASWRYIAGYLQGDTTRHSGYDFAHNIYVNTIGTSPWGVPPTFYLAALATKVPLIILGLALIGLAWTVRHAGHRGATFIRVFLVFTLVPYSLVASKFLRYMLPIFAVIDIAAAIGIAQLLRRLERFGLGAGREVAMVGTAFIIIAAPFAELVSAAPYYGLAQNALGSSIALPGAIFPDDELYDAGVREAVETIGLQAGRGAVICSEVPVVVAEYLGRIGRQDMRSCSIAHEGLPASGVETWVIDQPGHIYFENAGVLQQLRRRTRAWLDVRIGDVSAARVYRFQ
jgi:hypothetical protein